MADTLLYSPILELYSEPSNSLTQIPLTVLGQHQAAEIVLLSDLDAVYSQGLPWWLSR